MQDLQNRRLVLGLTGGIACYKSADLVRRLLEHGATVDVVMTEAATQFITPITMQAVSGRPVFMSVWDARIPNNMAHIDLSRGAAAILIAPTSADFIAKLAHGRADDLLSTLCLARNCPLLIAPAMNREMWAAPATQRNVKQLREDGVVILGPGSGSQACGETGDGRMLESDELLAETLSFFTPKLLAGKSVLITAGPTSEPIDPVRVISNRSSGKTGYAIALAAQRAGAKVLLVSGATALTTPYGVQRIDVQTARQMHDVVMHHANQHDIFVSVAAVADWHVANAQANKIKKTGDGNKAPSLEFAPNPDILATVAAMPSGPWCVGFAAETEKLAQHSHEKRLRKKIPMLIGNLAHEVMDADTTNVIVFDEQGEHPLTPGSKAEVAKQIIAAIAQRYQRHT